MGSADYVELKVSLLIDTRAVVKNKLFIHVDTNPKHHLSGNQCSIKNVCDSVFSIFVANYTR